METYLSIIGNVFGSATSTSLLIITVLCFLGVWILGHSQRKLEKPKKMLFFVLLFLGINSMATDLFMRSYSYDNAVISYECVVVDKYPRKFASNITFDKNLSVSIKHYKSPHGYTDKQDEVHIISDGDCNHDLGLDFP